MIWGLGRALGEVIRGDGKGGGLQLEGRRVGNNYPHVRAPFCICGRFPYSTMRNLETLISQLGAAAAVHSIDWLHSQVGGQLVGDGYGGSVPAPPALPRARKSRPLRCLPGSSAALGAPQRLFLETLWPLYQSTGPTGGILFLGGTRGMGLRCPVQPIPLLLIRCLL